MEENNGSSFFLSSSTLSSSCVSSPTFIFLYPSDSTPAPQQCHHLDLFCVSPHPTDPRTLRLICRHSHPSLVPSVVSPCAVSASFVTEPVTRCWNQPSCCLASLSSRTGRRQDRRGEERREDRRGRKRRVERRKDERKREREERKHTDKVEMIGQGRREEH